MALLNRTIDQNRLEVFSPAKVYPQMIDVAHSAYPTPAIFYRIALAGSLDGIKDLKDWADYFINGHFDVSGEYISNSAHIEWDVELEKMTGSIDGSGSQAIVGTDAQLWTKARMDFNKKYQQIEIPEDEWGYADGGTEQGMRLRSKLLIKYTGAAYKEHFRKLGLNILGDNTDSENGVISLRAGIGASAADVTTYAGISRNTFNAWRGNYSTGTNANWLISTSTDFSWRKCGVMVDNVAANGAQMNNLMFIMGTTAAQSYRSGLQGAATTNPQAFATFNLNSGRGIPHTNLYYGEVPVIHDPQLAALRVYLVDTATTKMIGVTNNVFKLGLWKPSEGKTAYWNRLHSFSNIAVMKPNNNQFHLLT